MRKIGSLLTLSMCVMAFVWCTLTLKADAANVTTGTLGDNNGITWTYDEDTKTLTITGEDTGSFENAGKSVFVDICPDVEKIIVKDCTVYNCCAMFAFLESLQSISFENFDTSQVRSMSSMFYNCWRMPGLDVSSFDTSQVETMNEMFAYCIRLEELDLSTFDTSKLETAYFMFYDCQSLKCLDISGFDLSGIEDVDSIFERCVRLEEIVTPKKMNDSLSVELPHFFVDERGNTITALTQATCNQTIYSRVPDVRFFVERMYALALGRESDSSGIDYWADELLSYRVDGAEISMGFIMSKEFEEKNYSDEEYVKVLYGTFFDREADKDGLSFWLKEMKAGRSRKSVLAGFVNSKEFTQICESYGINRGTMEDDATSTGAGQFVERLYSIALERPSDPAGLEDWAKRINNKTNTPEQVAKEFFLSPEYTAKKTSNEKYVEALYLVFMDRPSEAEGKAYWVEQLDNGVSREKVLEGFAQSKEFFVIMARYGLLGPIESMEKSYY